MCKDITSICRRPMKRFESVALIVVLILVACTGCGSPDARIESELQAGSSAGGS